jgi:hypothetical protein
MTRTRGNSNKQLKKMKDRNNYKYGIGFWAGSGIYSLINMIMNLNHRSQDKVLVYDSIITGVAVIGLILCIYLLNKTKEN